MNNELTGQCLCGAIAFSAPLAKPEVTACHCGQCRQWSGHHWASATVPFDTLKIEGEDDLSWFRSSDYARRGFCKKCGSALFWQADRLDEYKGRISIGAGCINAPTGLSLTEHIFVADRGDYYDIADGLAQKEKF